jgi:membrane fusion protein (multidrug efflux system)
LTKQFIKKTVLIILIIATCAVAAGAWIYSQFYINTDDAYVNANVVAIAPRITGQVQKLYVKNNQYVRKDQPLFDLDPIVYSTAVASNQAGLAYADAKLKIAQITAQRTLDLVKTRADSLQDGDMAVANLQSAIAAKNIANALLATAQLNLQYTHITAPASGWISNMTLREGNSVTANEAVFALVSDQEFWIDANFKETELKHISLGQAADIQVDMYPGRHFKGVVESISSGSGNVFSLLPPENATWNWVKVTQRVPVRIHVVTTDPKFPLRIGTSAKVSIRL